MSAEWRNAGNLLFCSAGILICYLYFGILQEGITKGKYGPNGEDRFRYTQSLVLVQCLANTLFARATRTPSSSSSSSVVDNVPRLMYAIASISYLLAMIASNYALQFIPYPTQVLAKSCKPIPIMIFGALFAGKKYIWRKYFYVILIVIGVALFLYDDKKHAEDAQKSNFGDLLLLASLAMDGMTGAMQDRMRASYVASGNSMMYNMNLFSTFYLLIGLVVSGELWRFMAFVNLYPTVLLNMIALSIASALGQYFIFKTVNDFGPLTCSILTTTRKLFTMLGSVLLFNDALTGQQIIASTIVFGALIMDGMDNKKPKTL